MPEATKVYDEHAGHPDDFPLDSESSVEQVREAAKHFLGIGGERPASGEWRTCSNGLT
jgi:hypothetical protein